MDNHPFIFSNARRYRITRHLAFWIFWWLFQAFLYAFAPLFPFITFLSRFAFSMLSSAIFMTIHIFLSYSLMYFVIPVYLLKNKYLATAVWVLLLFFATASLSSLISLYVILPAEQWLAGWTGLSMAASIPTHTLFFGGLLAGLRGGITIGGLAAAIKLMKYWYIKEQRNLQLQKENMEARLQLLKAQIHPHFMFNTLNNIYAYTQNTSAVASELVLGFSDMLRYMLYEGDQRIVPLAKELKMAREYITIEMIRYGNELETHIGLPDDTFGLGIAPLLLLPFLENCFKHGISHFLEHPWLSLDIGLEDRILTMKLINGKLSQTPANGVFKKEGIGLANVRKRLELLYPGRHELSVINDADAFIVNLRLELEKIQTATPEPIPALRS